MQTLCLHLGRSTPLHKTLTLNRYLRIEYFHQNLLEIARLWPHLMQDVLVRNAPAQEGRNGHTH